MPGPAGAAEAAAGHLWGRVDAGADAAEGRGHGGGGEVRHDRLGDRRVLRHLHQPLPVIPGPGRPSHAKPSESAGQQTQTRRKSDSDGNPGPCPDPAACRSLRPVD